jgi:hypothetical protein
MLLPRHEKPRIARGRWRRTRNRSHSFRKPLVLASSVSLFIAHLCIIGWAAVPRPEWRVPKSPASATVSRGRDAAATPESSAIVPSYHGDAARSGRYIISRLTWQRAATAHRDQAFDGRVQGQINAQPLYWRPANAAHGLVVVATEADIVFALDAATGRPLWRRVLGPPVAKSLLPCGNIDPVGITGTPVIDPESLSLYVDALVDDDGVPHHRVFGLRVSDGTMLPGWPLDLETALTSQGIAFSSRLQNQRGALALLGGRLYIPFGGNFGDCGKYHGAVVGVNLTPPRVFGAWLTRARKAGIWAPGGIASDGHSLFVTTGNAAEGQEWGDQEAVIRVPRDLHHSADPRDFFAPSNWRELDDRKKELGGSNPIPIDLPSEQGPMRLLLALGKDGNAYLLDLDNLGGIGGALLIQRVAKSAIRTAPAAYPMQTAMFVAFQAPAASCPGRATAGVAVLAITAGTPPRLAMAWCASLNAIQPVPIVTTTNGSADPIVWVVGASGDERLHGFRGDNGQPVFAGGSASDRMNGLQHFAWILAAEDALYIGGVGRLYAFRFDTPAASPEH